MARPRSRWLSAVENDFTLGEITDTTRTGIPVGGIASGIDVLVHVPGKLFKRGGIAYAGPKTLGFSADAERAIAYAPFPTGSQLIALGNDSHAYLVTPSTTTGFNNSGEDIDPVEKPSFFSGGAQSILVFCDRSGTEVPSYYDPAAVSTQLFQGGATNIVTGEPAATSYLLSLVGSPGGGTFRLAVTAATDQTTDQASPLLFVTATIAWNASAANVKTAIDNAIASLSLTCTSSGGPLPGSDVTVNMPAGITVNVWVSALTGGSSPYPKLTNATSGSSTVDAVSVPTARFSEAHLQRLVLANSAQYPTRLWFSPVLNVTQTGWDLANSWIDVDAPIYGLASLQQELLIFTQEGFYRLIGTIPPPDTDMQLEPISELGTTDSRSITIWEGKCIYANPQGVFLTAGVAPVPLMEGRIEQYWQSLFTGYVDPLATSGTPWSIATGVHQRRFLFVTVLDGINSPLATLCCDLTKMAWTRLTRLNALMYANSHDDLFAINSTNNRVLSLKGLFTPTAAVKNDVGMGQDETPTAVTCSWQTRPLQSGMGLKAFGDAEVLLDMRDAATDNPTMAVTVAPGFEATTAVDVSESPLAETSDMERRRVTVSKDSECVTLGFTQSNASAKTEFYGVEWSERVYSPFAEGE